MRVEKAGFPVFVWVTSLAAAPVSLAVSFFRWRLIAVTGVFLEPLLRLALAGLMLAAAVPALVLVIRGRRRSRVLALPPLLLLIACVLAAHFLDFTALWLDYDFKRHRADRERVVRKIGGGELRLEERGRTRWIALPKEFASLSLGGGRVEIEERGGMMVLFYTFRGVLDNFSGFVHSAVDAPPKDGDFNGRYVIVRKIQNHWYYVAAK